MATEPVTLYLEEILECEKALRTRINDLSDSLTQVIGSEREDQTTELINCKTAAKKMRLLAVKRERAPSANRGRPRTAPLGVVFPNYFVSNYQQLETDNEKGD